MKKTTVVAVAAVLIMGPASFSHAKYESGFEVVEVGENQVTIQKEGSDPVVVEVKKDGYKIGDKVKYDADRLRIKPAKKQQFEGC